MDNHIVVPSKPLNGIHVCCVYLKLLIVPHEISIAKDDYIAWKISSTSFNVSNEFTPKDKARAASVWSAVG